jgi:hypothetical protein
MLACFIVGVFRHQNTESVRVIRCQTDPEKSAGAGMAEDQDRFAASRLPCGEGAPHQIHVFNFLLA